MPPKKDESKQDFLGRCAKEKRAAGMADHKAMAECAGEWNKARMSAYVDDGRMVLSAPVEMRLAGAPAEGEAQAPDRFAILAYTGKVIEWGWMGRFVIDLKGIKLAKTKVPCLYGHMSSAIVGTIDKGSSEDSGFFVTGEFSRVETTRGPETLALAKEGFPFQASIGVQGIKVLHIDKGATHKVNGQTVEGPIDVWTQSSVFEVSFVPFGADDDTAAVAMSAPGLGDDGTTISPEDTQMLPSTVPDSATLGADPGIQPLAPAPAPAPDAAALAAATAQATADTAKLFAHGETLHLSAKDVQGVVALGLPHAKATEKLLELAAQNYPPFGAAGRIEMGADERDKFRLAAAHGTMLRMGIKPDDKPAPGYEEFRGLRMHELAKVCLERAGQSTRGLSPADVAENVLRLSGGGMSTSDFGAIFRDAAHKRLQNSFEEAGSTWRPWCSIVPATDFKDMYGVALSEAPDLDLIDEHGEYQEASLRDKQERYHVGKYGKLVGITLEMIVNDDLRAFLRLPKLFGAAAARKESDIIYSLLTSSPVMLETDKALFDPAHKNLASGADVGGITGGVAGTLDAARRAIRLQKGQQGALLNLIPKYLLIPSTYETAADVILRSLSSTEAGQNSGVKNPWEGKLTPVVDARLDNASADAWYMVADPAQVDTVEVAFLDGVEQPTLSEHEEYRTDALVWKIRHIFGAGIMDYRGFYKNPGK